MENPFQIIYNNPTFFIRADQWFEDGYVFYQGKIFEYGIDRKDGSAVLSTSYTIEDFNSRPDITKEEKDWAELINLKQI